MTAIGLAVAIPAAISYNTFARANRNTLSRLNSFAYDVFAFLATGIKTSPMLTDARATSEKVIAMARAQGVAAAELGQPGHPGLAQRPNPSGNAWKPCHHRLGNIRQAKAFTNDAAFDVALKNF